MRYILFILSLLCFQLSYSQSFFITVKDATSKQTIKGVRIDILDKDSAFVDSCEMITIDMGTKKNYVYASSIESNSPFFYLRCQKKGYLTQTIKVDSAKNIGPDDIMLKREPRTLSEVTVTATKVMMVMKGDTIVYNADAFELAEGSMLDQLIERLPGVKLSRGGAITINGNPVSSLLIDGKDFFKGDANVALENLPAFMVSKIKSYQKIPDNAYLTRKDNHPHADDPWVIDVNLKKEYHRGWIANAEAGGGTDKTYLGRFFGVHFSDRSRVSIYGGTNNVNNNQRPGREGNWENEEAMSGENKLIKGGLFASLFGNDNIYEFYTTLEASHTQRLDETKTSITNFYNSGNNYTKAYVHNNDKNLNLTWNSQLAYRAKFAYITLEQNLAYDSDKMNGYNKSQTSNLPYADFIDEGASSYQSLIDSYTDFYRNRTKQWNYGALLNMSIKLPLEKTLDIYAGGDYMHQSQNNQSLYNLYTPQLSNTPDFRNRYAELRQTNYNVFATADYALVEKEHKGLFQRLSVDYTIKFNKERGGRDFYRFDWLGGEWTLAQSRTLGWLPSTRDSLTLCTDWENTYHTVTKQTTHTPQLKYFLMGKNNLQLNVALPVFFERKNIDDLRSQTLRSNFTKHYTLFNPSLEISYKGIRLQGAMKRTSPLMSLLLDMSDNSNPLFVIKGNTLLKPEDKYSATLSYSLSQTKHAQTLQAKVGYEALNHAIGYQRHYNVETGVTTSTPQNINGNWQTSVSANYARSLDKKQKWTLDVNCGVNYLNSVDFQQTSLMQQNEKSIVKNLFTQGVLKLAYHCKLFNASVKALLDWQHATSQRLDFVTINSVNQLYTLTNQWSLPWDVQFDTDLTLFMRSGYADPSLNSDEWVWNVALSKRLLKSKSLAAKFSAHDILAQRSNTQRVLNAQGRTETWHNVIPRYFMLTLSYNFHKSPKNQQ